MAKIIAQGGTHFENLLHFEQCFSFLFCEFSLAVWFFKNSELFTVYTSNSLQFGFSYFSFDTTQLAPARVTTVTAFQGLIVNFSFYIT